MRNEELGMRNEEQFLIINSNISSIVIKKTGKQEDSKIVLLFSCLLVYKFLISRKSNRVNNGDVVQRNLLYNR